MRETPRKSANAKPAPAQKEPQPIEQKQESFKPSQNPQAQPKVGRRRPQDNPRYERLMALVEDLRKQFPFASDEQILEWAKKRMEFDESQNDLWSNVAREHGMPMRSITPKQQEWSGHNTPEWKKFAEKHGVPASVGWKNSEQTPMTPYRQQSAPSPDPAQAADETPAFIPGGLGSVVFNPAWGKKHGLSWDGSKWTDGSLQQQEEAAAQAERQFMEQKRSIELERLQMELELDRMRKQREMVGDDGDSPLAGLLGGIVPKQPVRALGPDARTMF